MSRRIDQIRTNGVFSLDGEDFDVENNVWIFGDDDEVIVVDAAHEAGPIIAGVAGRRVSLIACTHGHNDHINVAVEVADATGGLIALHRADQMLFEAVYPDRIPNIDLAGVASIEVAGTSVAVLPTPGHSPGGVSLFAADDGVVFTGDTLFAGGPGATGRSFSDFPTILESIRSRLLVLPPEHDRAHRARRLDNHRGRGAAIR